MVVPKVLNRSLTGPMSLMSVMIKFYFNPLEELQVMSVDEFATCHLVEP